MAKYAVFPKDYVGSIAGVNTSYKAGSVKQIIDQDGDVIYFGATEGVSRSSSGVYLYDSAIDAHDAAEDILDRLKGKSSTTSSGGYAFVEPTRVEYSGPAYAREYYVGQKITFDLGHIKVPYTVHEYHISSSYGNGSIFTYLKEDKHEYAMAVYGYSDGGDFPTARSPQDLDDMIECLFADASDHKYDWEESNKAAAARRVEESAKRMEEDRKVAEQELKGRVLRGKRIEFTVKGNKYPYIIRDTYLESTTTDNASVLNAIFNYDRGAYNSFCQRVYGYVPPSGTSGSSFPEWKCGDWDACERIIDALKAKASEVSLGWRLQQIGGRPDATEIYLEDNIYSKSIWTAAPPPTPTAKETKAPVFTGTSSFTKRVDDVDFDGLDVEELSVN